MKCIASLCSDAVIISFSAEEAASEFLSSWQFWVRWGSLQTQPQAQRRQPWPGIVYQYNTGDAFQNQMYIGDLGEVHALGGNFMALKLMKGWMFSHINVVMIWLHVLGSCCILLLNWQQEESEENRWDLGDAKSKGIKQRNRPKSSGKKFCSFHCQYLTFPFPVLFPWHLGLTAHCLK